MFLLTVCLKGRRELVATASDSSSYLKKRKRKRKEKKRKEKNRKEKIKEGRKINNG